MKKFILSVLIGGIGGSLLAWGLLFVAPRLPDVFVDMFFYPSSHTPVTIIQDIRHIFKPDSGQYMIQSVDQTVSTTTKVVHANLSSMNIVMFEGGEKIAEYPIQSVGREGTAWQTPLGKFDMSYKNKNHFSSIGHVWMPFSMHFFGNYFIHGWPYYEGGMPVAQGYSGGCIRLNTPDAEQIFGFVDKDTELVVTTSKEQIEKQKDFEYLIRESAPALDSPFLVADIETGEVIASHGAQEKLAIGSFAKLMTALISLETLNQYQETVLNQDIVHISDVLYALLLNDNDDAGQILYEHKNKAQYLLDMNTRADSLAMSQTHYVDVNGSSLDTVSTLEDTFKLLQYIHWYKPFLLKVLSLDSYDIGATEYASLYAVQKQEGHTAGFVDEEKTHMMTLVTADIPSPHTNSTEKKTFVIIVYKNSSTDVESDVSHLYSWMKESVEIRSY